MVALLLRVVKILNEHFVVQAAAAEPDFEVGAVHVSIRSLCHFNPILFTFDLKVQEPLRRDGLAPPHLCCGKPSMIELFSFRFMMMTNYDRVANHEFCSHAIDHVVDAIDHEPSNADIKEIEQDLKPIHVVLLLRNLRARPDCRRLRKRPDAIAGAMLSSESCSQGTEFASDSDFSILFSLNRIPFAFAVRKNVVSMIGRTGTMAGTAVW